jgi:hypothetical protein
MFQDTELDKLHQRLALLEGNNGHPAHLAPSPLIANNAQHPESQQGAVKNTDGSGTGRYHDNTNWTQVSDGTDYPGSYGVGALYIAPFGTEPGFGKEVYASADNKTFGLSDGKGKGYVADVRPYPPSGGAPLKPFTPYAEGTASSGWTPAPPAERQEPASQPVR